MIINLLYLEETYSYYGPKYIHVHHYDFITLYMVRLIVFNIHTFSCKIGWSLPYHFKTQLNLLGYCISCESESLYLIRSMHDQNLLIPHTYHHITTTSRKFLYFMLIFIKTSWSCYERYYCPNYHIFCIISCCNSVPNNLWWLVHDTL